MLPHCCVLYDSYLIENYYLSPVLAILLVQYFHTIKRTYLISRQTILRKVCKIYDILKAINTISENLEIITKNHFSLVIILTLQTPNVRRITAEVER